MTDAWEKLAELLSEEAMAWLSGADEFLPVADRILAALPDMIEPLEWHGEEQFQRSGFYRITHYAGMQHPFKLEVSGATEYHETREAAKAAANAHHRATWFATLTGGAT